MVGEPHPSKQGLKLYYNQDLFSDVWVGEPHPSKQGLKHFSPAAEPYKLILSASPIHQNKD